MNPNEMPHGGPAFPTENGRQVGLDSYLYEGMSLRDYFAAQALPTIISACANDSREPGETQSQLFAKRAYLVAAAMLAERLK